MNPMTTCPCGRHAFRWTDRVFVLLAGGGPVYVDPEQIPATCRTALQGLPVDVAPSPTLEIQVAVDHEDHHT